MSWNHVSPRYVNHRNWNIIIITGMIIVDEGRRRRNELETRTLLSQAHSRHKRAGRVPDNVAGLQTPAKGRCAEGRSDRRARSCKPLLCGCATLLRNEEDRLLSDVNRAFLVDLSFHNCPKFCQFRFGETSA